MLIKTIIFDFDGVFVHAETFSARLSKDYGISRDLLSPFFRGAFQKCLTGEADLKKEISFFYHQWGWKGTLDELLNFWFVEEGLMDKRLLNFVKSLKNKNIPCYLATNQEKYRIEYLKKDLGLEKIFDGIFSSAYLGCKKPDEIFYKKVFISISEKAPIKKNEILLIDDDLNNIRGAEKYGFKIFHYKNFEDFDKNKESFLGNKKIMHRIQS